MYRYALVVLLSLLSSLVTAGPNQLDVLGLVPGKSTLDQVKAAGKEGRDADDVILEIGGHTIPCTITLIEDRLANLQCSTGKEVSNTSNSGFHQDAVRGFSKKYGKPDTNISQTMRTRAGVEYTNNIVEWKDKQGNTLTLYLYIGRIDAGAINISSAEFIRKENAASSLKEKGRKF